MEQQLRMSWEKDERETTEIASHDAWVMRNVLKKHACENLTETALNS